MALDFYTVTGRAGLSASESAALAEQREHVNAYLASAGVYAQAGTSIGDYLQTIHGDDNGVWPEAVREGHEETQLSSDLQSALAKMDGVIRSHHPRLSATGMQRY